MSTSDARRAPRGVQHTEIALTGASIERPYNLEVVDRRMLGDIVEVRP
jgi:hypothetical protein